VSSAGTGADLRAAEPGAVALARGLAPYFFPPTCAAENALIHAASVSGWSFIAQ
jgi:hypothetical protein